MSMALRISDHLDNAEDLRELREETNLIRLTCGYADVANEIVNMIEGYWPRRSSRSAARGPATDAELVEALARLQGYAEVCPPLTQEFLDRLKRRDRYTLEQLRRWLLPADLFDDPNVPPPPPRGAASRARG